VPIPVNPHRKNEYIYDLRGHLKGATIDDANAMFLFTPKEHHAGINLVTVRVTNRKDNSLFVDVRFTIYVRQHDPVLRVPEVTTIPEPLEPLKTVHGLNSTIRDWHDKPLSNAGLVHKQVDFLWANGPPAPGMPADSFRVNWSGFIKVPQPGTYKFVVISDDGVELRVDNRVIIKRLEYQSSTYADADVELTGKPQALQLFYFEGGGSAIISLRWVVPGSTEEVAIPSEYLFTTREAADTAEVPDFAQTPSGGLSAMLYRGQAFDESRLARVDPRIDLLWGQRSPHPNLPEDEFSIRWRGALRVDDAGKYRLILVTDDGAKVWLDDKLIFNEWRGQLPTRFEYEAELSKDEYPLVVEYFEVNAGALVSLRWVRPGQSEEEVIPASSLIPWQDPSGAHVDSERSIAANKSHSVTLLPFGANWRFLDDGSNQGTTWRSREFNDSQWKEGAAPLGYGDGQRTKVNDGGNDKARHVSTYFRTTFQVGDPSDVDRLDMELLRDDAATVYLNGIEVFRDFTLPSDAPYDCLATKVVEQPMEKLVIHAPLDPARLTEGVNHIAVEVDQARPTSSDINLDLRLIAGILHDVSSYPPTTSMPSDDQIDRNVDDPAEHTNAVENSADSFKQQLIGKPFWAGRQEPLKQQLLTANGGDKVTEDAVNEGLKWLANYQVKQQRDGGYWRLKGAYTDGSADENRFAATGLAMLAFQGAGHTHKDGPFQRETKRAQLWLVSNQDRKTGAWPSEGPAIHRMYSHAICTTVLCELYGMTKDNSLRRPAQKALDYAVQAQSPIGGWRYEPGTDADTSVTGWFGTALWSGKMAGLKVPAESFERISSYLDNVAERHPGIAYCYKPGAPLSDSMTASALLCRQYLGWKRDNDKLIRGVAKLADHPIDWTAEGDTYYWYYATQVISHVGGDTWQKWNEALKREIPATQIKTGSEKGSWPPHHDRWGRPQHGGRLYTTCMCLYMLETYYRYLPLYNEIE
jgi:hypothetical protein